MKSYLDLVPISEKKNKQHSRLAIVCIILAVFLVTAIFSMADMEIRSQKIKAIKDYGNWHIVLKNVSREDAAIIASRSDVDAAAWYDVLNYRLKDDYYVGGKKTVVCGIEPQLLKIMNFEVSDGAYPTSENQILMSESAKEVLNIGVGGKILLDNPSGESMEYEVSGFIPNTSMVMRMDALAVFAPLDTFDVISAAAGEADSDKVYYVSFKPHVNLTRSIENIKLEYGFTDEDMGKNAALLGVSGFSTDSYFLGLYMSALALFLLVLMAGVLMIASSLNSNVSQRTEFFGMLRCIGAGRKQIIRLVRLEALSRCKTAVPLGVALGVALCWGLCAILRVLSPSYFGTIPVFGISPIGIISGAVVGVLTAWIAAHSPAKKAAKSSPRAAAGGGAYSAQRVRKAAGMAHLKADTALGIHHAKRNKKNFVLIIGSFALCIVLFLSFSVVVSFMNHAITPLRPYAPDVSIVSPDNTCSINRGLTAEISGMEGVKRVYGRSFEYGMSAELNGKPALADLISYEEYQFNWADEEKYVNGKDLAKVLGDSSYVLAAYDAENPINAGDKITLGGETLTVAGVLTTCHFDSEQGTNTLICSEQTFRRITGKSDYTIIDIQLTSKATDENVNAIRALADGAAFSDRRMSNNEAKGSYLAFALFVYGFIAVIAMITVFNIVNSISMSVSARIKEYGIMRAIGAENRQIRKMVIAEAVTYALSGSVFGCIIGLPIHRFLYNALITARWGDSWQVPLLAVFIIVLLVVVSSFLASAGPVKRIVGTSVTRTLDVQ